MRAPQLKLILMVAVAALTCSCSRKEEPSQQDTNYPNLGYLTSELRIQPNGNLIVTEAISFDEKKNKPVSELGRILPLYRPDQEYQCTKEQQVNKLEYKIQLAAIEDGGASIQPETLTDPCFAIFRFALRATDPNPAPRPVGRFDLQYEVGNAVEQKDLYDQILWPVSGYLYVVPIGRIETVVVLPPGVPAESLRVEAFVRELIPGESPEQPVAEYHDAEESKPIVGAPQAGPGGQSLVAIRSTKPLAPMQVFFVRLRLGKGVIHFKS